MLIEILGIEQSELGFGIACGPCGFDFCQVDCFPGVESLLRLILDHAASIDQTLFVLFLFFLDCLILAFDLFETLHA
jgi:hypothetical protein